MGHTRAANALLRVHARGLARLVSRPAYRRLLDAEPLLRRAVPVLIVVFLAAVALGAAVQILDHRRQALADNEHELSLLAFAASEAIVRRLGQESETAKVRAALADIFPSRRLRGDRSVLVTDAGGRIIAVEPAGALPLNERLADLLGASRALAAFASGGDAFSFILPNGTESFAAVRDLEHPLGQVAVLQPKPAALARWVADSTITVTLVATTGFVLLILGFAFHWQAARAREADEIFALERARMDTALNRGRSGMWDWDLASGRIYWSDSMFEILARTPRDELLAFGEVDALVHPDDG
ncbi:MAG TPA: PAS domain-containing sensor histidine kinase, partial [Xanthobacteraceae bacterium]|nr:PAS domain-containing sensor histidine kinase [Xanthobacteraceae bacterium]